jgi:hypothetical protein
VLWIVFVGVTYFMPTLGSSLSTSIFTAGYGIFLLIIILLGLMQFKTTKTNNGNGTEN